MAVVLAAAILTSVAAAAADSGYFSSVFKGETSYIADFVKTDKKKRRGRPFQADIGAASDL